MIREFRRLIPLIHRHRWSYVAGVAALLVTSGGQLFIPLLVGNAIDNLVDGHGVSHVGRIMLTLLGIAVVVGVARFGWRYFIHGASRRIETELRRNLFDHLLVLSPEFYRKTKTGDLMARATNDMQAIRMATGMALVAFVDGVFMTLAILAILITRNLRLALFTVLPLPLITVMIVVLGGRIGKLFRKVQEGFSRMSDQAQEVLSGIRVVKALVKEDFFLRRFADANENYQRRNMQLVRVWGLFFPLVTFLSGTTLLILLWFGGRALLDGTITTGDFVATLGYLQMLTWPMLGAGFTVNMLQRGAASLGRINEVLNTPAGIRSPADGRRSPPRGSVEVRNLTFLFPDQETPALRDLSFSLPRGDVLGILGRTGSGKSSVAQVLPRLLDPPVGTVFIDGTDIRRYDLDTLRRAFGIVSQDTFLFSATIMENIRFARPDASRENAIKAGTLAALGRDIDTFPQGWDTVVGERGVTLSGGQRQRIAIARALLPDPEILILDDALSAVDTRTEERILSEVLRIRKNLTTVVISNRVSTLKHADRILVLEDGAVVQQGTHESLLLEPGLYRDIFHLQQLERIKESA